MWGGMESDGMYNMCCVVWGVMCQCGLGLMRVMLYIRSML